MRWYRGEEVPGNLVVAKKYSMVLAGNICGVLQVIKTRDDFKNIHYEDHQKSNLDNGWHGERVVLRKKNEIGLYGMTSVITIIQNLERRPVVVRIRQSQL